jgi:hypothetical protein
MNESLMSCTSGDELTTPTNQHDEHIESQSTTLRINPWIRSIEWRYSWARAFPLVSLNAKDDRVDADGEPWCLPLAWQALGLRDNLTQSTNKLECQESNCDWNDSLGYGELTFASVWRVLDMALPLLLPVAHDRPLSIVDLGSGSGRLILAAGLYMKRVTNIQANMTAIEIVPQRHEEALANYSVWKSHEYTEPSQSRVTFDWICDDFLSNNQWISQADLIFCHATHFGEDLWQSLQSTCQQSCRLGTRFCFVTRCLDYLPAEAIQLEMDWGMATAYLQIQR